MTALSSHLWTYEDNSFLPHGSKAEDMGQDVAQDQFVWLTAEAENPNEAQVLFLVDGAMRDDISGFLRCVYMFDGADETAVAQAREVWKK